MHMNFGKVNPCFNKAFANAEKIDYDRSAVMALKDILLERGEVIAYRDFKDRRVILYWTEFGTIIITHHDYISFRNNQPKIIQNDAMDYCHGTFYAVAGFNHIKYGLAFYCTRFWPFPLKYAVCHHQLCINRCLVYPIKWLSGRSFWNTKSFCRFRFIIFFWLIFVCHFP